MSGIIIAGQYNVTPQTIYATVKNKLKYQRK